MTIRAWREEAGGARRVLEGSREEEMEALRQSGFEQRQTRWHCVGQRLHGAALSLSLSSLFQVRGKRLGRRGRASFLDSGLNKTEDGSPVCISRWRHVLTVSSPIFDLGHRLDRSLEIALERFWK
jgi:hypothetical protein